MEYLEAFFLGGSVIAGSKLVSRFVNPALAPLIGGLPTGIIASFFMNSDSNKRQYFAGYAYSAFILFLAVLFIHLLSSNYKTIPVNYISIVSFILWAVISYFIIQVYLGRKK